MAIYLTSDWHLGHRNILAYCERPFDSVEEMDEVIVQSVIDTVGPDDTLYLLGDIVWKDNEHYREMMKRIDCTKILISGNHDASWTHHKKGDKVAQKWVDEGVFDVVTNEAFFDYDDISVRLNHFPYVSDSRHDDKYAIHLPKDNGDWLFHGHVHTSWTYHSPRQLNVGVDIWDFEPIPMEMAMFTMRINIERGDFSDYQRKAN